MSLEPTQSVETIMGLVAEGLKKFKSKEAIYIHAYALNSGALSGNMRKGTVSLTIWCIVSGA